MGLNRDSGMGKEQVAWSTPVTSTLSLPVIKSDVDRLPTNFVSQQVDDTQIASEPRAGFYHYAGTVETEVGASGLDLFWKSLLGDYVFAADTPVASANTHTHTLATASADQTQIWEVGFSYEFGSGGKWFLNDSCVISSVALAMETPGFLTATWGIMAEEQTEAGSGQTHAPPAVATMFDNFQITFDVNSVTQPLRNMTLNFDREVTPKFINTSQSTQKWITSDFNPLTGTLEIELTETERTALETAMKNSTNMPITITMTSDQMVTGSTPYSTTITMPKVKLTEVAVTNEGNILICTYNYVAYSDTSSEPITVANVNGDATL
jgi:hypothetical protein